MTLSSLAGDEMVKAKELSATLAPSRLHDDQDRLDSWKEIASYLKREVRTVQLWEKREALPVHRHFHNQLGSVYAFRSEIDAWGMKRAAKQRPDATGADATPDASPRQQINVLPLLLMPVGKALSTLLLEAARLLDPVKVELLYSMPDQDSEFVLRWKTVSEPGPAIAELFSVRRQMTVWSRAFDAALPGWPLTPKQLADQLAQCLWLHSVSAATPPARIARAVKPGAREAYLKGRYFWSRRNEHDLRKAMGWFQTAIKEDPDFALPYTGLADSLTLLSFYELVSPAEAMPKARDAAMRAIELEPDLAEAHTSLADIHLHFDWQWDAAGREYRKAIQCNPGYALGYHWYANLLAATGQHDAAYVAVMQALEIDPCSLITQVWAGVTSHLARRYDDAIRHYQNALELDPNFTWAHMYLAQALEQKGRYREALAEFDTTIRLAGGSSCVTAMKAHAHAKAGDRKLAQSMLTSLRRTPSGKCAPSYDIAATYAALGEHGSAVEWLERACQERNMKLFSLSQDPRFDALRGAADFRGVVQQLGLAG